MPKYTAWAAKAPSIGQICTVLVGRKAADRSIRSRGLFPANYTNYGLPRGEKTARHRSTVHSTASGSPWRRCLRIPSSLRPVHKATVEDKHDSRDSLSIPFSIKKRHKPCNCSLNGWHATQRITPDITRLRRCASRRRCEAALTLL